MRDNNLLASVALFRELYDNDRDIYDIIAEFILSAIAHKRKWVFNSTEMTNILRETFDFKIPEAVVRTTIKNRLVKEEYLTLEKGFYKVNKDKIDSEQRFSEEYEKTMTEYSSIVSGLIDYIERKTSKHIPDQEKETIVYYFNAFLTDGPVEENYSNIISSFIIESQHNPEIKRKIDAIKEGLILYNGIRYTSNLNELGSWNHNLTIYLDTEHLFNAVGYNGLLYKELFDDFLKYVNEINSKQDRTKISLKYFSENKSEIQDFFHVAELIIQKKANLDPSKTAMLSILDGCHSKSDILSKKSSFYQSLAKAGITLDDRVYPLKPEYNVEDQETINSIRDKAEEFHHYVSDEECRHFLKIFTKINTLRKGVSNTGFEKIGYIFMTGKALAQIIARSKEVKFQDTDVPFAFDIDYITNKFWFKLKKGLSDRTNIPKSFSIVTKAQIVISTQINNSVSLKYKELSDKYEKGETTKDMAEAYHSELRSKVRKPEEINPDNLWEVTSIIHTGNYESYIREMAFKDAKIKKGDAAEIKLKKLLRQDFIRKRKSLKSITLLVEIGLIFLALCFSVILIVLLAWGIISLISSSDSTISVLDFSLTVLVELLALLRFRKTIQARIKRISRNFYKKVLVRKLVFSTQEY